MLCPWARHFTLLASGECLCTYCKSLWMRASAKMTNDKCKILMILKSLSEQPQPFSVFIFFLSLLLLFALPLAFLLLLSPGCANISWRRLKGRQPGPDSVRPESAESAPHSFAVIPVFCPPKRVSSRRIQPHVPKTGILKEDSTSRPQKHDFLQWGGNKSNHKSENSTLKETASFLKQVSHMGLRVNRYHPIGKQDVSNCCTSSNIPSN